MNYVKYDFFFGEHKKFIDYVYINAEKAIFLIVGLSFNLYNRISCLLLLHYLIEIYS